MIYLWIALGAYILGIAVTLFREFASSSFTSRFVNRADVEIDGFEVPKEHSAFRAGVAVAATFFAIFWPIEVVMMITKAMGLGPAITRLIYRVWARYGIEVNILEDEEE